ncbi:hypothetical protein HPB48_025013 [Haemaphysalis longicornis]|uniref:Uncharacterized protein n=1 Tax=Haemaphysalis longicornis TaxID=44386 RepID=A0A9J6H8S6_HAELO|nr:hypothetical protein HPB48_025013 [Haemaphysalis longicornis]
MDFDRACSEPEQRCWLCTELTPWNQAMHGFGFELVELRPGKLRLRPIRDDERGIEGDRAVAAEASLLVSWLLQHHRCIDELKVVCTVYPAFAEQEASFPIRLRPALGSGSRRTIRRLVVKTSVYEPATNNEPLDRLYQLEGLDAVCGLEKLKLELYYTEREFADDLAKLLRRNAGSIKKSEIPHTELPRQVTHALRYLFNCETLTLSSGWNNEVPSVRSVARLLHSSTALKELSITRIASTTDISAIAKELEINTSLTKLSLEIGYPYNTLEAVFTALQANTTLKELSVTDCYISEECGQALALLLQKNTGLRLLHIGDADISEPSLLLLASALTRNTTLESLHLSSELSPDERNCGTCKVLRVNKTLQDASVWRRGGSPRKAGMTT